MDRLRLEKALENNRAFLAERQPILYGARKIRFDLESRYADFDGMLKREIVYCRYDVREQVGGCVLSEHGEACELQAWHDPLPPLPGSTAAPESLSAFLVRRRYLALTERKTYRLSLPGYEGEAELKGGPEGFALTSPALRPRPQTREAGGDMDPDAPASRVRELETWWSRAFAEWGSRIPELRIESTWGKSASGGESVRIGAWKRVSQVDIDTSLEERPDVFRWQEATLSAAAAYADLPESECLAILRENRSAPPPNARLQGIAPFEPEDGAGCLVLRYAHILPDPGSEAGDEPQPGCYRSRGAIVVERDFWEYHIDAGTRRLVGEYRKWRPVSGDRA